MNSRSSKSSHRLQLRLISEDSIKIFIYHITRADFYLNARTNFYNMSWIPRLYKGLKLDSFRPKSRQCVRSHAKIFTDPHTVFRKNADFEQKSPGIVRDQCESFDLICPEHTENMFIGGGQDWFSHVSIGCHKYATSIIALLAIQNFWPSSHGRFTNKIWSIKNPKFWFTITIGPVIFFEFPILILFSLRIQNQKYYKNIIKTYTQKMDPFVVPATLNDTSWSIKSYHEFTNSIIENVQIVHKTVL